MQARFDGKVGLVTGAASGIGLAAATALAREGAHVVLADLDLEQGQRAAEAIAGHGRQPLFVQVDVSKTNEVKQLIARAVEAFGRIDCAFNNAGIIGSISARTAEGTEENWDRVLATNLKGAWLCMKYEIQAMRKSGGGAIVNASSAAGMSGSFGSAPYVASKHGVIGLTKAAAIECTDHNIRVNAVCPGYIRTPMTEKLARISPVVEQKMLDKTPMRRLGTPEEVVTAVLWLLSDESAYVTGHALAVDGGILAD